MKKTIFLLSFVFLTFACKKTEDPVPSPTFNYDLKLFYGTWLVTSADLGDGNYIDPNILPGYTDTKATFNADGTFSSTGLLGSLPGTYKAAGNTIVVYFGGIETYHLDIIAFTSKEIELKVSSVGSVVVNFKVKATKQ